ncbi:MAG: glycosyltransferase family 9 protein [Planctomycetota bacterium]
MHLLFHQAALGDFVLAAPVLRGLADPVTVVAPWSRAWLGAQLRPGCGVMDIEMFEFGRLFAEGGPTRVSPAIGELFASATTVVSFVSSGRDAWSENARRLMPNARLAFAAPRPRDHPAQHVAQAHRRALREQGVELPAFEATLPGVRINPTGPIVVHPGSGGLTKCWPTDRYAELIERLRAAGQTALPVLGEVELDRWPESELSRWTGVLGAEVCPHVEALWRVLEGARAFIGNDAGPTHLAAAMGVPTLALFGPSDPKRWAPLGPCVRVAAPEHPGPMAWLDVDRVRAEAAGLLTQAGAL